jgi:hypothetical protein
MTVPASAKSDGADPTHRSRMTFTAFRGSGPVRRFRPRDACTACHGLIVDRGRLSRPPRADTGSWA